MTELDRARRHLQKCQERLAEMRALHVRLQGSCKDWTDVALARLAKFDAETELRAALSWAWDAQEREPLRPLRGRTATLVIKDEVAF
jgi:hypothetical protein